MPEAPADEISVIFEFGRLAFGHTLNGPCVTFWPCRELDKKLPSAFFGWEVIELKSNPRMLSPTTLLR